MLTYTYSTLQIPSDPALNLGVFEFTLTFRLSNNIEDLTAETNLIYTCLDCSPPNLFCYYLYFTLI